MKRNYIKTSLLLVLFVGIKSNLAAQIETFELSDYKLPDLKRHGIDLGYYLNAGFDNSNMDFEESDSYSNSKHLSTNLSTKYFFRRNTNNYQGEQNFEIRGQFHTANSDSDFGNKYKYKTKSQNYSVYFQSINRFYYSNLLYWGLSPHININSRKNLSNTKRYAGENISTEISRKTERPVYNLSFPVSVGKGRIEPVEDARQTLFVLDDLRTNGRLSKEPSHEEILKLAAEISKIKNKRVLDARLKKKYELQELDAVLKDMGLVKDSDILYFTSINDMWLYGGLQERSAGTRIALEYIPSFSYDKDFSDEEEEDFLNATTLITETESVNKRFSNRFGLNVIWEKPIRQKFQSTFSSSLRYELSRQEEEVEDLQTKQSLLKVDIDYKAVNGAVSYRFGFYPNTRTLIIADFLIRGTKYWTEENNNDVKYSYEWNNIDYRTSLSVRYYFSPRLQTNLICHYSINKSENIYDTTNSKDNWLEAFLTINYSIF